MNVETRKINSKLPYDPAIPLLGVYLKELKVGSQWNICVFTFIAALVTIANGIEFNPKN